MPEAVEYRTIMYSVRHDVGHEGEVVKHKFPWNPRDAGGMEKLQKMVEKGFTFADPRKETGFALPEVIVKRRVAVSNPEEIEETEPSTEVIPELKVEPAPLYVSGKKPRKKRRSKRVKG